MQSNPGRGIQYLSLSLLARQVINTLSSYLENKEAPLELLDEAIESLKAVDEEGGQTKALHYYEQSRTLRDSSTAQDRNEIINTLGQLRSTENGPSQKKVVEAIEFFFKIEQQALANFERSPSQAPPQEIVRLCQNGR